MINRERNLEEFLKLVRISSESRKEKEIACYLYDLFKKMGYSVKYDDSKSVLKGNSDNIIINIPGQVEGPVIMLSAHMDTVAPGEGVEPEVVDGYVRSKTDTVLGSDDKAGIAAIIEAIRVLREQSISHYPLQIIFTCAEEIGLQGVKTLPVNELKADYGFVLDSNGDVGTVINRAPYQTSINFELTGRAAHAGMHPEKGINAIHGASRAIAKMNIGRIDEETTANIGVITGGIARNVVPEKALIKGEARSLRKEKLDQQLRAMEECVKETCKESSMHYEIEKQKEYDGYVFDENQHPLADALQAIKRLGLQPDVIRSGGGSDANVFNLLGIPSVVLGIGMEEVHTVDERISLKNLNQLVELLIELVRIK